MSDFPAFDAGWTARKHGVSFHAYGYPWWSTALIAWRQGWRIRDAGYRVEGAA